MTELNNQVTYEQLRGIIHNILHEQGLDLELEQEERLLQVCYKLGLED